MQLEELRKLPEVPVTEGEVINCCGEEDLNELEEDLYDAHELLKEALDLAMELVADERLMKRLDRKDARKWRKLTLETMEYLSQWTWPEEGM